MSFHEHRVTLGSPKPVQLREAKIEGQTLTSDDLGRTVVYVPNHAAEDPKQWEHGKLSSFRPDGSIFVRFKGPTGERCNPENLRWGVKKLGT